MSLISCPECRAMVSDKAVACPHCGCPIESAAPVASARAKREEAPKVEAGGAWPVIGRRRRKVRVLGWSERLGCLVVLLVLAGALYLGNYLVKSQQVEYVPKASDAYAMVVMQIKNNLNARSPVKFPPVDQADSSQLDRNTFRFSSFYFMKGADGQRQSTRFTAVIRYTGQGEYNIYDWKLVSLDYL